MPDYLLPASQFPGRMMLARTYLPLESVSCCPHCGTILGTDGDDEVTLHLVDPGWCSMSAGEFGLRPPLPPRSLSADATEATCPYCNNKVELSTVVHRDPDEFLTIEM
jgi:hypothetical protein